ncbi:MAG: viperin family antiviral radical SAM protein [Candidatus Helarchaeota archaeon]
MKVLQFSPPKNSIHSSISKYKKKVPIAINFHVWPKCNYQCKFCFAHFKDCQEGLSKEQALSLIALLSIWGIKKINFAGGEPTLCPYLGELLHYSKELGLTTSIISNGTGISREFLTKNAKVLDWVGLSIDSGNEVIQRFLGRGRGDHVSSTIKRAQMVKKFSIKLKINTVVTSVNYQEDMNWLIKKLKPDRWKVFQVLPIENENKLSCKILLVTKAQFGEFIRRHKENHPIVESNRAMLNSYVMIDPRGRFYQNTGHVYVYSRPILEVGIEAAFQDICWDYDTFRRRGGIYAW